jgi:hypothetical protein
MEWRKKRRPSECLRTASGSYMPINDFCAKATPMGNDFLWSRAGRPYVLCSKAELAKDVTLEPFDDIIIEEKKRRGR